MEDTLGELKALSHEYKLYGLNPCSNGRYSRSLFFLSVGYLYGLS